MLFCAGSNSLSDLVRDGAQLYGYISFPRKCFGKRMVSQSVAVPDARGVEEEGVKNVLVYISAFIIYKSTVGSQYIIKENWKVHCFAIINDVFHAVGPLHLFPQRGRSMAA